MATRQYIGARYVPKFFENPNGGADWVANTQYEGLTIVTRNGNSYTSRKNVPANIGAPELNPDYWVSTGIFNEQLEALQNEFEEVSFKKQSINSERKFILISDSYGVGTTAGGTTTGWCENFKTIMGLDNDSCIINVHGGSGFVSPTYTFLQQVNEVISSVTDKDSITDIIICGGYNDQDGNNNSIYTAIGTAVSLLKTNFENATVYITMAGNYSGPNGSVRTKLTDISYAYRHGASGAGAVYFDTFRVLKMLASYMSTDYMHPTTQGYVVLAEEIANFIMGGQISTTGPNNTATLTGANGITVASGMATLPMRVLNNYVNIFIPAPLNAFNLTDASAAPNPTAYYKLATISNNIAHGITASDGGSNLCSVPCSGWLRLKPNSKYINFKGVLCFNYDSLWIMIRMVDDTTGSYRDLSSVDTITLDPAVVRFPIDFI